MSKKETHHKRTLSRKQIILLVIIFAFLFLEIYLRINSDITRIKGQGMFLPDDDVGYTLKPGFSEYVEVKGGEVLISINNMGLRGEDRPYEKEGTQRIVALGGSIPFGSDIEYEDMYLRKLETRLNEEGTDVEVINGALPGYQFNQHYGYYFKELHKYDPDVVLLSLVLDDIMDTNVTYMKETVVAYDNIQQNEGRLEVVVKKACYSCVFFYGLYLNQKEKHVQAVLNVWSDDEIVSRLEDRLAALNANLSAQGIPLIVIVFPYNQQFQHSAGYSTLPQETLKNITDELDITYIDLMPYLDKAHYEEYYLVNDKVHLNNKGFEQIEDILYWTVRSKLDQ